MKRGILFLLVFGATAALFAQVSLPEHHFASGSWNIRGQRLYQNDTKARLAKVNIRAPQSGPMVYEFAVRYESGAEDGHGGFGLHIFGDRVFNAASWGSGNSYLLWLNYDENPLDKKNIPAGLSAQIYRSYTDSRMDLLASYDLNDYAHLLTAENLAYPVYFKIWADGNTGEVRVYDPVDSNETWYSLGLNRKDIPLKGNWVTLRTNGIGLSFTN
jgi:hypothetical protein